MGVDIKRRDYNDPIEGAFAVTPDDVTELAIYTRAIYVGGAGHLTVTTLNDTVVTFSNVPVGWHPIRAKKVHASGTGATLIIACY
jgi:hypothetical protein